MIYNPSVEEIPPEDFFFLKYNAIVLFVQESINAL